MLAEARPEQQRNHNFSGYVILGYPEHEGGYGLVGKVLDEWQTSTSSLVIYGAEENKLNEIKGDPFAPAMDLEEVSREAAYYYPSPFSSRPYDDEIVNIGRERTSNIPFDPVYSLRRYINQREISGRLDKLGGMLRMFLHAAQDPELNPHIAPLFPKHAEEFSTK